MPLKTLYSKLDDYQKSAVTFSIKVKTSALIFEQGTGKTWIAAGIAEQLSSDNFSGLFVVPLANLETSWLKTLKKISGLTICRTFDEYKAAACPKLLLINYEGLAGVLKRLLRITFTLIVYDESQRLKARGSLASRTARRLGKRATYKVLLTGTPIDKQPGDLWAQFRFLDPEILGDNWAEFEAEFYHQPDDKMLKRHKRGTMLWKRALKIFLIKKSKLGFNFDKLPLFQEIIKPYTMHVTKDVLNLPPSFDVPVPVTLRGRQRRMYDELETRLITRSSTGVVSAPLKVTLIGKLQQICGGYIIDDDGYVSEVGRAKLRALKRIRKQVEGPLVIFCRYKEEVFSICEEMKGVPFIGETKNRPQILRDFQRGRIPLLVCQIKTGGVGVDLFRSNTCVFFSYTYSYIDFEQAKARIHRRGQTRACTNFLLYAEDTVDKIIYQSILDKRSVVKTVLTRLKQRRSS